MISALATEEEILGLVRELAEWRHLTGYKAHGSTASAFDARHPELFADQLRGDSYMYLVPGDYHAGETIDRTKVAPKYEGWIHIKMGGVFEYGGEQVVTITDIQAGRSRDGKVPGDRYVAALRARLKKRWRLGVKSCPAHSGKSATEWPGIFYSDEALRLYKQGARWQEGVGARFDFCPIESPQSE